MSSTRPFDDLRRAMERRRLTACGHDLHIAKQGTRWGVAIEPESGDVFGGPCNGAALDEQPGDTLGQDWREHWRRVTDQPSGDDCPECGGTGIENEWDELRAELIAWDCDRCDGTGEQPTEDAS